MAAGTHKTTRENARKKFDFAKTKYDKTGTAAAENSMF